MHFTTRVRSMILCHVIDKMGFQNLIEVIYILFLIIIIISLDIECIIINFNTLYILWHINQFFKLVHFFLLLILALHTCQCIFNWLMNFCILLIDFGICILNMVARFSFSWIWVASYMILRLLFKHLNIIIHFNIY